MEMAGCFYLTRGSAILRNCNLCIRKCAKIKTWSSYLEKLQFIHKEMRKISNLGSQDVCKEILSTAEKSDENIPSRF